MTLSVNANSPAWIALQALANSAGAADGAGGATAQPANPSSATSGAASSTAAAAFAIAASVGPAGAVQGLGDGSAAGASLGDAAAMAGQTISDLLQQMQQAATAAGSTPLDSAGRASLQSGFAALLGQVNLAVQAGAVGGRNLLDGSATAGLTFQTSGGPVSLTPVDLTLGGPVVAVSAQTSLATASGAAGALSLVNQSLTAVGAALDQIGQQTDQLNGVSTSQAGGAGSAADPDAESVRLMALQLQQALGAQPAAIANQSTQAILSLFNG